jgi:hypothetical protein
MDVITKKCQLIDQDENLRAVQEDAWHTLYFMFMYNPPTDIWPISDESWIIFGGNRSNYRRTERSQVDNMGGLEFLKQLTCLFLISTLQAQLDQSTVNKLINRAYLRSPWDEPANIQVSLGLLPNLEFAGSVLIICSIALPTRPVPPVTRMTVAMVVVGSKHTGARSCSWYHITPKLGILWGNERIEV